MQENNKNAKKEIWLAAPLEVKPEDAFKNDALDRKIYGEALRDIIINSPPKLVIALDGDWGEGKTTFVKMCQGLLSKGEINSIYIDAFENDYVGDPFLLLSKSIISYANDEGKEIDKFRKMAKETAVSLIPSLGKALVSSFLSDKAAEDFAEWIEKKLGNKEQDQIKKFKESLSEISKELNSDGKTRPLVIIIDELDRCKPTFAVDILEKVKHLFSVENVVFLLVMNKKQLQNAIQHIYGQGMEDAHTYLQKFIDIDVKIPKVLLYDNADNYSSGTVRDYCWKLAKELGFNSSGHPCFGNIDYLAALAAHLNLSLRQIETGIHKPFHVCKKWKIAYKYICIHIYFDFYCKGYKTKVI